MGFPCSCINWKKKLYILKALHKCLPSFLPGRFCRGSNAAMKLKDAYSLEGKLWPKEIETHSSVLAWRIPAMGEPGGLLSMGSHRVGHDWSDLAAAVFPILLFSSISLHWLLRKAFLSLLASLWNSTFRGLYLSFSLLLFASLFAAIFQASSDSHFAFLHFFSMEMFLIPVSCTMSWTSIHRSSGILSMRSSPLNLFLTSTV